ncbi:MAG: AAA family ATPase [Pirellulaceae bacterium]|jgi:MoxR-like ATPase|nr:AAA family ATPase [Pirellulaceae bacterium]
MEEERTNLQEHVDGAQARIQHLLAGLNRVLLGKPQLTEHLVTGILAGGHVLLEGLPGIGKTELVKGLARLCAITYRRVQFTPDLLPSDITGSFILQEEAGRRDFAFQEGPVFTNVLLGDEINRASPKTQSALLEAMAERSVTVLGQTRRLPDPFFVIATQNPIELEGTYPLPEAQVDRFLFKLRLDQPGADVLSDIVRNRVRGLPPALEPVLDLASVRELIQLASHVYISEAVAAYIARLVQASHPSDPTAPPLVKQYVRYGASPRAAISLASAAQAQALLRGRVQAGFDSVTELFAAVMNHRLILDYSARVDAVTVDTILSAILQAVEPTAKPLPAGVR